MKASGVIGKGSDSFPRVEGFEAKKRGICCAVYYKLLKLTVELLSGLLYLWLNTSLATQQNFFSKTLKLVYSAQ